MNVNFENVIFRQDNEKRWHWEVFTHQNQAIARSRPEGYETRTGAVNSIESALKLMVKS